MAYSPFNLTGKVALVTGGNGGIGLGMADAMAAAGASVVIWGTNADKNRAAEERLGKHGVMVLSHRVDVSNEGDMTAGAQSSPAFAEKVIPRVPMRRWGEPADFGGIAVYLASNASAYHSGDTFLIDGGYAIF